MSFTYHDLRRNPQRRSKRAPLGGGEFGHTARPPRTVTRAKAIDLPQRPDPSILSAAIPVFFIGRNGDGFWVARESEGKQGGVFLRRSSAVRFANQSVAPNGCAIMDLSHRFELDIQNNGNPCIAQIAAAKRPLVRLGLQLAAIVRRLGAPGWRLASRLSRARAANRLHRKAIERELFNNRYKLAAKSDDDLPIYG